jgi:hypothetical protein
MTRDEVIATAKDAGFDGVILEMISHTYNLGAENEREACAQLCDDVDKESQSQWPKRFATMIRARGNQC